MQPQPAKKGSMAHTRTNSAAPMQVQPLPLRVFAPMQVQPLPLRVF